MSGEKLGQRERIAITVEQMVKGGANPEYAKEKARKAAMKEDRKNS